MIHKVKSFPEFFAATLREEKRHEIRQNDDLGSGVSVGDVLVLEEFDPATNKYTGRTCKVEVTFISDGEKPWVVSGYTVMSIKRKRSIWPW